MVKKKKSAVKWNKLLFEHEISLSFVKVKSKTTAQVLLTFDLQKIKIKTPLILSTNVVS